MGRAPCCEKDSVKRGPWTPEEDAKLLACIAQHGTGSWRTLPKKAGLQRCGKSCRLRWTNYLRPDLKHGRFTDHEEQLIVKLHAALGSRWSLIAAQLPGRTDNDVKNYWNTRLKKKLCEMGIDPITHKPISQLLADLAGSIAIPKGGQIAEAALGCFKDDMLNVLMRKRPDWQLEGSVSGPGLRGSAHHMHPQRQWDPSRNPSSILYKEDDDDTAHHVVHKMKQPKMPTLDSLNQQHKERPDQSPLVVSPGMLLMRAESFDPTGTGCYYEPRMLKSWSTEDEITSSALACTPSTSLGLHVGAGIPTAMYNTSFFQQQQQQQQRDSSVPGSRVHVPGTATGETNQAAWSPSGTGSSCSSTTLADVSVLEGVLSSDVPLWDFSELSSIMS